MRTDSRLNETKPILHYSRRVVWLFTYRVNELFCSLQFHIQGVKVSGGLRRQPYFYEKRSLIVSMHQTNSLVDFKIDFHPQTKIIATIYRFCFGIVNITLLFYLARSKYYKNNLWSQSLEILMIRRSSDILNSSQFESENAFFFVHIHMFSLRNNQNYARFELKLQN